MLTGKVLKNNKKTNKYMQASPHNSQNTSQAPGEFSARQHHLTYQMVVGTDCLEEKLSGHSD
jgi:hypothetical protein